MSIYNMKADGDHWRITKFSSDLEVESSYLVLAEVCDCPAGNHNTCRHRQMLPLFEAKNATRGQYFLDFDRKVWLPAIADVEFEAEAAPEGAQAGSLELDREEFLNEAEAEYEASRQSAGAHAFTMLDLANPRATHNAIAEALGEPTLPAKSTLRRI